MTDQVVNRNELRITGMSRSGNHAIINWVLQQLPGRYCFLNCCEGKANPFETARGMDDGRCYRTNIGGFDLARERDGDFRPKDWLIFSHEDNFLGNAFSSEFDRNHDLWVGSSARRTDILILRDPYNLFASRIRRGGAWISLSTAARIWKQHARCFIEGPRRDGLVLVSYNRWVADRRYRGRLAARLRFPFSDAGIECVPSCAGGSSFDGRGYDGSADEMRVFERWRHYADDPRYQSVFDEQMVEMSRAIFGELTDAESVLGCVAA